MNHKLTRVLCRFSATLAVVCLTAGSAACAPMAVYNPDRLPPAQMSRIGEICHTVMGLPAGTYTQYEACEESLSHSLAARREGSAMLAARQACEARGLKAQTVALAQCELHPPQSLMAQANFAVDDPPATPSAPVKSYFSASNDEIHRREQEACVEIGEDPATSAFAQCVIGLQANLFDADNPMH